MYHDDPQCLRREVLKPLTILNTQEQSSFIDGL
jgi:glucokinase